MKTPPSIVHLPPGPWATVLEALCARFPDVAPAQWLDRLAGGRVLDGDGAPIGIDSPYRPGLRVHYHREVADEAPIPVAETVLHADADLVVADKPHFLPVMPTGRFVAETLIARLICRLDNPALVALHRLDRATAGLVLLSPNPASRDAYQALFRERRIAKRYECLAPALPHLTFPLVRSTRLAAGEPFFRTREVDGPSNAETRIDVVSRDGPIWRYALEPITGKKHQLRVHMAALGAPIVGDPYYPVLRDEAPDDHARPLCLLAQALSFVDPLSGVERRFASALTLSAGHSG